MMIKIIIIFFTFNLLNSAESSTPLINSREQVDLKVGSESPQEKNILIHFSAITDSESCSCCSLYCCICYNEAISKFNIKLPSIIQLKEFKTKVLALLHAQANFNPKNGILALTEIQNIDLNNVNLNDVINLRNTSYVVVIQKDLRV